MLICLLKKRFIDFSDILKEEIEIAEKMMIDELPAEERVKL
jgi:hypothetical protein